MTRPDPSTTFAILGSLEVVRDGTRIQPESVKLRTLLVDLLVHRGETRSADRLIDDLWGSTPPTTAVGVLQNYVSQLRKLLGPDVIRRQGTGYRVEITPDQLDRDRFVTLVDSARSAHAAGDDAAAIAQVSEGLALWRGEALTDVAAAEFAQPEIARLRETRAAATELLFEAELTLGRHRETVAALEAALITDPLRERLWWLLMTALHRSGRQADALRAYQRARQTLIAELGIEPGPELRALQLAVLEQRADATAPKPSEPLSRVTRDRPELAGRASELETLNRFLAAPSGMLLLTGEPGIGKTRLLEEAQLRFAGSHVAGRAYEAERGRPYGPWVDALRASGLSRLPTRLRDALAPLLPELSEVRSGPENTTRLYDAVVTVLRHLARAGGVLVVIDDVQWLDERSASLLHFAIRQLDGTVAFLASARPLELATNQACARTFEALRRADLIHDLVIGPLAASSIDQLARRVAPGADLLAIARASDGNPLLALEMARAIARGDDPFSSRLDGLIGDRLARLSANAAELVPWVAAFGRSATPAMLAAAAGRSTDELVEPLAELERFGVLVAGYDGTYDFAHDLVRDVAYRRLSTPHRTRLHERIGKALLTTPDFDDILAADAARHANAADDSSTCAAASVRAARRCVRLLAYEEAAAHVATGRRHAGRLEPGQRVTFDVQLVDVLLHPGLKLRDPGALGAELADLCAQAQQLDMADELSTALILLARVYHWGWGDIARASALMERAVQLMRRAVQAVPGPEAPMAEPLMQGARCLAYLEIDMPRTFRLFDDLARLGALAEASHQYQWGKGLVRAWSGDTATARAALREAIMIADARRDLWVQFECTARLALLDIECGERPTELCEHLTVLADRLGGGGSEPAYAAAITAVAEGAEPGAAIAELQRIDAPFLVPDLLGLAAESRLREGDLAAADQLASRALELAGAVHRPSEEARAHALLATIAAARGDAVTANRHLAATETNSDQWPAHVIALRNEAGAQLPRDEKETAWQ